jgi:inorganic pyrophosphatase
MSKEIKAKDLLNELVDVVFDRPMGTKHPKFGWEYPINYGYVPNTKSEDGMEIDVYYLSSKVPLLNTKGRCIGYIHREDDNEEKLIVVDENDKTYTDKEILEIIEFQEKWYKSKLVRS